MVQTISPHDQVVNYTNIRQPYNFAAEDKALAIEAIEPTAATQAVLADTPYNETETVINTEASEQNQNLSTVQPSSLKTRFTPLKNSNTGLDHYQRLQETSNEYAELLQELRTDNSNTVLSSAITLDTNV